MAEEITANVPDRTARRRHASRARPAQPVEGRSAGRRRSLGPAFRAIFRAARVHPRRRQRRAGCGPGLAVDALCRRAGHAPALARDGGGCQSPGRSRGPSDRIADPRFLLQGAGERARAGQMVLLPLHRARRDRVGRRAHAHASRRAYVALPHGGVFLLQYGVRLVQRLCACRRCQRVRLRAASGRLFLRIRAGHIRQSRFRRASARSGARDRGAGGLPRALRPVSQRSRSSAAASGLSDDRRLGRSRKRER